MSSDSSDDENLEFLKEAADGQFINDGMFQAKAATKQQSTTKNGGDTVEATDATVLPPSLRRTNDEDEQFNFFRVTPEFRHFVAKNLTKTLDKHIKYVGLMEEEPELRKSRKTKIKGGVRLLRSSSNYLKIKQHKTDLIEQQQQQQQRLLNHHRQQVKQVVTEEELGQIAVSAEEILSKIETKNWSKRVKHQPYVYATINNKLQLVKEGTYK